MANTHRRLVIVGLGLSIACTTGRPSPTPTGEVPGKSAISPLIAAAATTKCGTERWNVKTLSDKKVSRLDFDLSKAEQVSIADVNDKPAHCHPGQTLGRFYPEEFKLFEVTGFALVIKTENDRDYHIGLYAENDEESPSLVVEVVDPTCPGASNSPEHGRLVSARQQLDDISNADPTTLLGQELTVVGVGFFDREHGQTGLSNSCMEIHPVLTVKKAP
jgi:hypothetical protein